jgi:O-succinylbenzoate synthase
MLRLYEYRLPFCRPFKTAVTEFTQRKGIILRYRNGKSDLLAEAAPLPGFSKERYDDVKKALMQNRAEIDAYLSKVSSLDDIRNALHRSGMDMPSIEFAVSFLGLSLLADRGGKTVFELLKRPVPDELSINAVAGNLPPDQMKEQIMASAVKGFRVIKIKAVRPSDELASVLNSVLDRNPELIFRLDANRSWPTGEIRKSTEPFAHLPIEYVEEPASFHSEAELQGILSASRLPVALDESVRDVGHLQQLLSEHPDLTFVIKPMRFGNILHLAETIQSNRSSCRQIIVTTALESAIGRSMVAVCAALFGDPERSHGLRTGTMLERDILPDPTDRPVLKPGFFHRTAFRSFTDADLSQIEPL